MRVACRRFGTADDNYDDNTMIYVKGNIQCDRERTDRQTTCTTIHNSRPLFRIFSGGSLRSELNIIEQ